MVRLYSSRWWEDIFPFLYEPSGAVRLFLPKKILFFLELYFFVMVRNSIKVLAFAVWTEQNKIMDMIC